MYKLPNNPPPERFREEMLCRETMGAIEPFVYIVSLQNNLKPQVTREFKIIRNILINSVKNN